MKENTSTHPWNGSPAFLFRRSDREPEKDPSGQPQQIPEKLPDTEYEEQSLDPRDLPKGELDNALPEPLDQ